MEKRWQQSIHELFLRLKLLVLRVPTVSGSVKSRLLGDVYSEKGTEHAPIQTFSAIIASRCVGSAYDRLLGPVQTSDVSRLAIGHFATKVSTYLKVRDATRHCCNR